MLSHDAAKLFKTQDTGYLRTMIQKTRKIRERIEQEYVLGGDDNAEHNLKLLKKGRKTEPSDHVVFVDSREDQKSYDHTTGPESNGHDQSVEDHDEDLDDDIEVDENKLDGKGFSSRKASGKDILALQEAHRLRKRRKREQEAKLNRLEALQQREEDLRAAERELELQRAKMNNNVGGITKAGHKFKVKARKR